MGAWRQYWWYLAASRHMLGEYDAELDITDRWPDSTSRAWQVVRGRALAALGRERDAMELLPEHGRSAGRLGRGAPAEVATELSVHGHPGAAVALAESVLSRLELGASAGSERAENIAWANRLLGRKEAERGALERIVRADADTLTKLQARPGSPCCSPTPPPPNGSTASSPRRATSP